MEGEYNSWTEFTLIYKNSKKLIITSTYYSNYNEITYKIKGKIKNNKELNEIYEEEVGWKAILFITFLLLMFVFFLFKFSLEIELMILFFVILVFNFYTLMYFLKKEIKFRKLKKQFFKELQN